MGDESTVTLDPTMQAVELGPVPLDREAGNGPGDLAEEVGDRSYIVERHPQGLVAQVHHEQSGSPRVGEGAFGTSEIAHRLRTHQDIGQLAIRACPDQLGEERPPRTEDRAISAHGTIVG